MLAEYPFLSSLIWFPIIGGLLVTFFGERLGDHASKVFALIVSLTTLLVSLALWKYFEYSIGEMQKLLHGSRNLGLAICLVLME
jgi:NADH-quinone oxidoreductase subunit M